MEPVRREAARLGIRMPVRRGAMCEYANADSPNVVTFPRISTTSFPLMEADSFPAVFEEKALWRRLEVIFSLSRVEKIDNVWTREIHSCRSHQVFDERDVDDFAAYPERECRNGEEVELEQVIDKFTGGSSDLHIPA
jgi:hypothetical protein